MDSSIFTQILLQTLTAATPLILAATGEIIAERSGIANIGIEGMMLLSAFFAVYVVNDTLNPWYGVLVGMLVGGIIGLLHGYISAYLKGNQIVTGIGVNLFAIGFVPYGIMVAFNTAGYYGLPINLSVPKIYGVSPISIIAILLVFVSQWFLFKTQYGIRLRACGENPESADSVGIHVERTQMIAATIGGLMAGLAGAFLSIDWLTAITKQISAGRGFIALAITNFANWNPIIGLGGSFVFGFFWVVGEWIKNIGWLKAVVPVELINTIPYVATLVVTAGIIGRSRPPKYVGVPYKRE